MFRTIPVVPGGRISRRGSSRGASRGTGRNTSRKASRRGRGRRRDRSRGRSRCTTARRARRYTRRAASRHKSGTTGPWFGFIAHEIHGVRVIIPVVTSHIWAITTVVPAHRI